MKTFLTVACLGVLLSVAALAQSTNPPATDPGAAQPPAAQPVPQTSQAPTPAPAQAPQTSQPATSPQPGASASQPAGQKKIASGSVIPVQLTKTIDAKKAKTGEQVVAKVTEDMKTSTGEVLVPKDTKIIGHVTEAQPRSKDQKESELAIMFDKAEIKNGNSVDLPMSIQAIIGQQNNLAAAGNDQAAPSEPGGAAPSAGGASHSPMAGSSTPQPNVPPSADTGAAPTGGQSQNSGRPPVNAQTTGVIGLSNINLSPNSNAQQGSVVTSDKNNVKLESGTVLLLRVNQ